MIHRVTVLGGGSAGLITALALKAKLPSLAVTVLRSKDMGVIGVGESTMPDFLSLLHGYIGIDPVEFQRQVMPGPKLGARLAWGPRPSFNFTFGINVLRNYRPLSRPTGFYCRQDMENLSEPSALMSAGKAFERAEDGSMRVNRQIGYHIENTRLGRYLESACDRAGIPLIDAKVAHVRTDERGIAALVPESGERFEADLFIDSSGFASTLLGRALAEPYVGFGASLFCDRAVVGSYERGDEPVLPYTTVETMPAGWCWRIEHPDRVARGYVYASTFLGDAEAESALREHDPKVTSMRLLKFPSGRYGRAWVKNVVAVGNAAGFVEPLGATSLSMICREARRLVETLRQSDFDPGPASVQLYNEMSARSWESVRDFLAVHYRFNTRLDTPFWRACRADVDLCGAEPLVEYYREEGPNEWGLNLTQLGMPPFGFLPDAFYCVLLGQRVPYRRAVAPTDAEARFLAELRAHHADVAARAFPAEAVIRRLAEPCPGWDCASFAKSLF